GNEVVRGGVEKRDVMAIVLQQRVSISSPPILLDQIAKAQVFDPVAAAVDDVRDRPRQVGYVQGPSHHVAQLFERRSKMRGAAAEDMANGTDPAVSTLLALMARASRDQPSHTVADEDDLLHSDGPRVDQLFHFLGQQRAVFRNVETGIVAEIERRVAEVLFHERPVSRLAVAVSFFRVKPPHLLVARETMNEHGELSAGARICASESLGVQGDDSTLMTKFHAGP